MDDAVEKIALIGSEGSGKTCFLAGLKWISSPDEDTPFSVTGKNPQSQGYLEMLHVALKGGHRPPPSHKVDKLDLVVGFKNKQFNIEVQDAPGEDFMKAALSVDEGHPIMENLLESRYVLICLDVERDVKNRTTHLDRIEAIFAALTRYQKECQGKKIALLLTKADLSGIPKESWTEKAAWNLLKENRPSLVQKMKRCGFDMHCFFISSLGSPMMNNEVPEPCGYENVFSWLVQKRGQFAFEAFWEKHPVMIFVGILAFACVFTWVPVRMILNNYYRGVAISETVTEEDRISALKKLPEEERGPILDKIMEELRTALSRENSIDGLQKLHKRISGYCSELKMQEAQARCFETLQTQVSEKLEDFFIKSLEAHCKMKDENSFRKLFGQYTVNKFSSRRKYDEAMEMLKQLGLSRIESKRIAINTLDVDFELKYRDKLVAKMKHVEEFVSSADIREDERMEMKQAVKDMKRLLTGAPYKIKFEKGGKLVDGRRNNESVLRMKVGSREDDDGIRAPEHDYVKGTEPVWNSEQDVTWKVGDQLEVSWVCRRRCWWDDSYASAKINGCWHSMLDLLSSSYVFEVEDGHKNDFDGDPYLKIRCDDFPDPAKSKKLIEKYLVPGTYWRQ